MSDYDPYDELPELPDDLILPPYLRQNGEGGMRTYGELSYNRRSRSWVIKGEPAVCQMAKRLFPGCDGKGRGVARFTANRRNTGDLNWLMLRYPLEIAERDRQRWEEALAEAREYAVRRERAEDEVLPWDHIDAGVTKEFLLREKHKAERGETTPDCRKGCQGCGLQRYEGACRK